MDDYDGVCGEGRFTLISTVSRIVRGNGSPPPQTTTTTLPPKSTTTTRPSGVFKCPEQNGLFRNPDDCSKYFNCANWYAYSQSCPSGLRFNDRIKNCDWPFNVNC
jgi:hypothetical protein